jgi:hypothetical protein
MAARGEPAPSGPSRCSRSVVCWAGTEAVRPPCRPMYLPPRELLREPMRLQTPEHDLVGHGRLRSCELYEAGVKRQHKSDADPGRYMRHRRRGWRPSRGAVRRIRRRPGLEANSWMRSRYGSSSGSGRLADAGDRRQHHQDAYRVARLGWSQGRRERTDGSLPRGLLRPPKWKPLAKSTGCGPLPRPIWFTLI